MLVKKTDKKQAKVAALPARKPKDYGIKPLLCSPLFIPFPFGIKALAALAAHKTAFFFSVFSFDKQIFLKHTQHKTHESTAVITINAYELGNSKTQAHKPLKIAFERMGNFS